MNEKKNPFTTFFKEIQDKKNEFLKQRREKKEEKRLNSAFEKEVEAIDVNAIPRPYNNPNKTGNVKIRDFSPWDKWKNILVGLIAVVAFFILWRVVTTVDPTLTSMVSSPALVWEAFVKYGIESNFLWLHLGWSLSRILVGYAIATVTSIIVAFLMAWYKPIRAIVDPFIQFLRCIPPLAYITIVIVILGTGENSKYFVIWMACFLSMTVTIYQGIRNVDLTLIKASYTFGAKDINLFKDVMMPSSFPFILTAMRLGVGIALTTLIAAELTGGSLGFGAFVNNQMGTLNVNNAIMGVFVIGIVGIIMDKILLLVEKRLTRWK